jgi:hypothetical protein
LIREELATQSLGIRTSHYFQSIAQKISFAVAEVDID